jgi:hypothetical protein
MKNSPNQDTVNHFSSEDCVAIAKLEDEIAKGSKELEGLLK